MWLSEPPSKQVCRYPDIAATSSSRIDSRLIICHAKDLQYAQKSERLKKTTLSCGGILLVEKSQKSNRHCVTLIGRFRIQGKLNRSRAKPGPICDQAVARVDTGRLEERASCARFVQKRSES